MKKEDLRSGMVVVTREGNKGIVLLGTTNGNVIGGCGDPYSGSWKSFDAITDDLTSRAGGSEYDIVKIYDADSNKNLGTINLDKLQLIWERSEPKFVELTIEQIAEKLGINAELLKIIK
jgi:hypothetical protein